MVIGDKYMVNNLIILPMSRLSERYMLTEECVVATKGKIMVWVNVCYNCCLHYALSVKAFVCCFECLVYTCC